MIASHGPSLRELSNHSVEVDLAAAQDYEYVARVIARVFESKTDHRRLPIFLLQRFKMKGIRISHVGLRIIRYSLLIRHLHMLSRDFMRFVGRLVGLEPTTS